MKGFLDKLSPCLRTLRTALTYRARDGRETQLAALRLLRNRELTARTLRTWLEDEGVDMDRPSFYFMMARLETSGLVEGRYRGKSVRKQRVRERWYKLTPHGKTVAAR